MEFLIILAIFLIWLLVLSWFVFSTRRHYFNLTSRTKHRKIDEVLDTMLENEENVRKEIVEIKKDLVHLIEQSKLHFRKVGLVRFNPFERTGGEQSFVLALLDEKDNGIIMNFIYTREGLRVYSKKVKQGQGDEYILSEEEKRAIERSH